MSAENLKTEFKRWLQKQYKAKTVEHFWKDWMRYIEAVGEHQARTATFNDVMDYVGLLRSQYSRGTTVRFLLNGVKAWYRYLAEIGEREDNPCRCLYLKDARYPQPNIDELLTAEELEKLWQGCRYERLRHRVMMSLFIRQGLRLEEVERLPVESIDLVSGKIHIDSQEYHHRNRTLTLHPEQILLLHEYISTVRAAVATPAVRQLLLTNKGTAVKAASITEILKRYKHLIPSKRVTVVTIRQSVIRSLLKAGHNVRVVQVFAGHKKPSQTERFKENKVQQLRQGINKYHPLQ